MSGLYALEISSGANRALQKTLPEKVATAVYEFITTALLENPHRVGKKLGPPLAPALAARRGPYRVVYEINEDTYTVRVIAIEHRSYVYRTRG